MTSIPKLIAGFISMASSEGIAAAATRGLSFYLETLNINPVILGLSALIAAVGIGVVAYNHFNVSLEEHKKALDDAKSEYSSTTSEIESLNDQLKTTQDRLSELSGKGSLTVTEQGEYDKLVKTNDELERQIQLKDAIAKNAQKQVEQEAISTLNSNGYYDSKFGRTTYGNEDFWGSVGSKVDAITAAKNYGNVIETLDQQISDLNQKYADGKISEEAYLKQSKTLDSDRTTAMGSYGNVIQDIQSEIESLNGDTTEEKNIISSANDVIDKYTSLTRTAADATSGFGEALSDASDAAGALQEKSTLDILDSLKDKYEILKQAQEDVNDTGYVSASTLDTLLSKYPELSGYLVETSDGYKLTKNSLDNFVASQRQEYQLSFNNAQSAAQSIVNAEALKKNGFDTTTMSIKQQLLAMEQLYGAQMLQKRQSLAESLRAQNPNISSQDLASNLYASDQDYLKLIDKARTAASNIDIAQGNLAKFKSALGTVERSAADKSSKKNETELYVADIDKLAGAEQRLKNIQDELSSQNIFDGLASNYAENIANIQKEISLYKQEQIAIADLNAERTKQIRQNISKLESQGFSVAYNASANRLAITNMEHINEIVGKTTDETNELRKAAEELIDTTQTLNDDNIQGTQDWYSALKSIKDEYSDLQSTISDTVEKAFDKVSDLLNDEKEAYETQKSNLESVASTVTSYINDYIDSLQDQNDELEKQISLQEKLEALDKAKTQRNKRIYVEGVGFTWQADASEVSSAQEEYDSALREYDLDERIQELQDYAQAWEDATDAYQNAIDQNLANTILGTNWRSDALNMDYDSVYGFQRQYGDVLSELDEDVYGSVAYQIKNLEGLQKEWGDSVDEANSTGTDYQSVLDLISTYESGSYSTRLSALSDFVSSAISQYQALANAATASANATTTVKSTVTSSGGSGSGHSGGISVDDILNGVGGLGFKDGYNPYSGDSDSGGSSSSGSSSSGSSSSGSSGGDGFGGYGDPSDYVTNWDDIKGYSNGGVVGETGIAMLHGDEGHEVIFNAESADKLWNWVQNTDLLSQSAANMLVSSNLSTGNSMAPNSNQSQSFSIGKIYVSGVNNVDELVSAIKTEFPAKMMQSFYKR